MIAEKIVAPIPSFRVDQDVVVDYVAKLAWERKQVSHPRTRLLIWDGEYHLPRSREYLVTDEIEPFEDETAQEPAKRYGGCGTYRYKYSPFQC